MATRDIEGLSDDELRARLKRLAEAERRIGRELIAHLVEYDKRRLYRADGVSNLWEYCSKVLRLTEDQIAVRIRAARAVKDHPVLGEALERGEIGVSAIRRLAPALTADNAGTLVEQAKGKPLREVERLAAGAIVARELGGAQEAERAAQAVAPSLFESAPPSAEDVAAPAVASEWVRIKNPDSIQPVSAEDWRIAFIAGETFVRELEHARNLLARRCPRARLEDVLGAAVELLLDQVDPARRSARRSATTARVEAPGGAPGAAARRSLPGRAKIPQALRDAVLERDGNQCALIEPDGRRCPARRFLEIDHIVPLALGGETRLGNLRALCRGHNAQAAELAFGVAFVRRAIERRRAARAGAFGGGMGLAPPSALGP